VVTGWELVAADRGSAHPLRREGASSVAPRLASLSPRVPRQRRPESGEVGWGLWPTPTLRPHCPLSSSSDSTASGNALTRSNRPAPGHVRPGEKRRRPRLPPVSERPPPAAVTPVRFRQGACAWTLPYLLTPGRNFL